MPHIPDSPGIERFPGRVLHAHDFRDKNEFSGKTLLLIGSSYLTEDIAVQCIKYGASKVIITWRSNHRTATGQYWQAGGRKQEAAVLRVTGPVITSLKFYLFLLKRE